MLAAGQHAKGNRADYLKVHKGKWEKHIGL